MALDPHMKALADLLVKVAVRELQAVRSEDGGLPGDRALYSHSQPPKGDVSEDLTDGR